MRKETFAEMTQRIRAEMDAAESLVVGALAMPRPRLTLVKGARAMLLCRSTYGQPYRVTDLDELGPSGHREYRADDVRGMAQEIASALRAGFTLREAAR